MECNNSIHKDIFSFSSDLRVTNNEIKELNKKVDSLQRGYVTDLVIKSLEEKRYAAITERERRY